MLHDQDANEKWHHSVHPLMLKRNLNQWLRGQSLMGEIVIAQ